MPVLDTEVLFGLNPHNKRHKAVKGLLERRNEGTFKSMYLPDTTLLEFTMTLRAKEKSNSEIREVVKSVKSILITFDIIEANTFSTDLVVLHYSLLEDNRTFFDTMIAASTLLLDKKIISDDEVFDRIKNIERIPLTREK